MEGLSQTPDRISLTYFSDCQAEEQQTYVYQAISAVARYLGKKRTVE